MKNLPLVLRVYGERSNGQWSLICLDFNLAVQADTLPQASATPPFDDCRLLARCA